MMELIQDETMVMEVIQGLLLPQKKLSPKFFYDERGSQLFDEITGLDEYYPTRTETQILHRVVDELFTDDGDDLTLVELGSGSSVKTELLLDRLPNLESYVPLDISADHLHKSAARLARRFPHIEIRPVVADYTVDLPTINGRKIIFFPGSTIGNFERPEAVDFLTRIEPLIGEDGGLLLGVDLKKDPARLHAAYNDQKGITAAFNLNMLSHLNHKVRADFNLSCFYHYAFFNPYEGRIEMHLVSKQEQTVCVANHPIYFAEGDTIWTESSYKYTLPEFAQLARLAGLQVEQVWTDPHNLFSVQYLKRG